MISKMLKREKKSKKEYIVLSKNNMIDTNADSGKKNISFLMNKLSQITECPMEYEMLTEEEVCVLMCGEMKIDTENKTIKVENLKTDKALVELANIC